MDTRADATRWIRGFEQAEMRSRLQAKAAGDDSERAVSLSLALMEAACRVERSPAAQRRRSRESAVVRELWRRAAEKQKALRRSKRSQI
ncbi:MAG: hypothetical protein ACYC8T_12555 [Myxococcaceae bacterium]